MKFPHLVISFVIAVLIAATYFYTPAHMTNQAKHQKILEINGYNFTVDIADTPELRTRGLSGRKSMNVNEGMLFIFPNATIQGFWMKEMYFPLDFVWILGTKIVNVTENIPPPDQIKDPSPPIISSEKPVDHVLEINAGMVKKLNIKSGDSILLK